MKKKTSNRVTVGPLKDEQDKLVTDSKKQANILNRWYCSVFTREDTSNVPEAGDVYEGNDISTVCLTSCVCPWQASSTSVRRRGLCLVTGSWQMSHPSSRKVLSQSLAIIGLSV